MPLGGWIFHSQDSVHDPLTLTIPMESLDFQLSACVNSLGVHSGEFIKYLGSNYEVVFLRYEYPLNRKLTTKEQCFFVLKFSCPPGASLG